MSDFNDLNSVLFEDFQWCFCMTHPGCQLVFVLNDFNSFDHFNNFDDCEDFSDLGDFDS